MCTQRFYLLIFVWFLIHLLSITPIQCKRHRRSLNQHNPYQNHRKSVDHLLSLASIRKKRSGGLKSHDLLKPTHNSTDDPEIKLNSNLKIESEGSLAFPVINNWNPKSVIKGDGGLDSTTLDRSFYRNIEKNLAFLKNGEKEMRISTKLRESSTHISSNTYLPSTSDEIDKLLKESGEKPKILLRNKRSSKNDFSPNISNNNFNPKKETLTDIERPSIFEDLESDLDQENPIHIRVKRDNPNKNNVVPNFQSNYLEDLAASFPKSEYELEEERLASNKVEDSRLFKRSSDLENKNLANPSKIELNHNFKRKDKVAASHENSRYQQKNLYSNLKGEALELKRKRYNYGKVHPKPYSVEDEIGQPIAQIANNHQNENLGDSVSYEYVNDNQKALEIPYQKSDKKRNSKTDYKALNGYHYEKKDQKNIQNDATKKQNLVTRNSYLSEAALEKAPMRFPGREIRLNTFRSRRGMKPLKKNVHKKKAKKKKFKKKHHRKKKLKKHSKQNRLVQLDKVVGDLQVESKIEKKDSTDGKSEVDIAKRDASRVITLESFEKLKSPDKSPNQKFEVNLDENTQDDNQLAIANRTKRENQEKLQKITKNVNESFKKVQESVNSRKRIRRNENESKRCIQPVVEKNQELKYYEDIYEPETNQLNVSKLNNKSNKRDLESEAKNSVHEIKSLVDKLLAKVNYLHNFVDSENKRGKKETEIKSKLSPIQTSKAIKRCTALQTYDNITSIGSTNHKLQTKIDEVLRDGKKHERKEFLEREKKSDSNQLVQFRPEKQQEELKKQKRSRWQQKSHQKWDRWTDWSSCSVTCGKGRQIRWRHCIRECYIAETEMEEKACQLPACPPVKFLGIF